MFFHTREHIPPDKLSNKRILRLKHSESYMQKREDFRFGAMCKRKVALILSEGGFLLLVILNIQVVKKEVIRKPDVGHWSGDSATNNRKKTKRWVDKHSQKKVALIKAILESDRKSVTTRDLLLIVTLLALALLGQQGVVDVRENTTRGNGDSAQELVQLLVVLDGQSNVAGDDAGLLVVAGSVAGQLENLSSQVLHDCGHVDGGTSAALQGTE